MFNFQLWLITLPGILVALTFHEYAHGLVADKLGDPTARYQGRLTLNPVAHLDPVGFIMLLLVHFGWAKPVPVNPYNLRNGARQGMLLVSLAGPATNLLVAVVLAIILRSGLLTFGPPELIPMVYWGVRINIILAVFNLIPIPPLDGSKILAGILPGDNRWLHTLETYGFIILILLLFTGVISGILSYIITPITNFLVPGYLFW